MKVRRARKPRYFRISPRRRARPSAQSAFLSTTTLTEGYRRPVRDPLLALILRRVDLSSGRCFQELISSGGGADQTHRSTAGTSLRSLRSSAGEIEDEMNPKWSSLHIRVRGRQRPKLFHRVVSGANIPWHSIRGGVELGAVTGVMLTALDRTFRTPQAYSRLHFF